MKSDLERLKKIIESAQPCRYTGKVTKVTGFMIESLGPQAMVGELCQIQLPDKEKSVPAEVVAIDGSKVRLITYVSAVGIQMGCQVVATGRSLGIPMSNSLLGRVIDSMGNPLDGKGPIGFGKKHSVFGTPPDILNRQMVQEPVETGVRSIDSLLTVGLGQRLGIFSPAGTGKTTLLGMIARNTQADINVIALVGERGREVGEFIRNDLGEEKLAKSVVVVSTSDTSPVCRVRGAYTAVTVAEHFRDQGKNVMLFFDSLSRFARAQSEIGLSIGEVPATRGYPPSVFTEMPKLLERCANSQKGTLTGFFTVLVEGDDRDEPISDSAEGFLDGHIILSRKLSEAGHYPAVDVLQSVSRSAVRVAPAPLLKAAEVIRHQMAVYRDAEDLINVGAYNRGTNKAIDMAIEKHDAIDQFLIQDLKEKATFQESMDKAMAIAGIR